MFEMPFSWMHWVIFPMSREARGYVPRLSLARPLSLTTLVREIVSAPCRPFVCYRFSLNFFFSIGAFYVCRRVTVHAIGLQLSRCLL